MRLDIRYRTLFGYDAPVSESQNELRACPVNNDRQQLLAYRVTTAPACRVYSFTDYWGTRVDHIGVRLPHLAMEVIAEAAVETSVAPAIDQAPGLDAVADEEFIELHLEYLRPSPHTAWPTAITERSRRLIDGVGDSVVEAVHAIHEDCNTAIEYDPDATDVGVTIDELLEIGAGVCQDYAHMAVALCRSSGIPARYVSGYLFTSDDRDGDDVEDDVVNVQTHAWMEAAVPGHGWLALDPTNRQPVGQRHVKIGHGRDYDDVQPFRGVHKGVAQPVLEADVEIRRMEQARQPTTAVQPVVPRPVVAQQQQQQQQ